MYKTVKWLMSHQKFNKKQKKNEMSNCLVILNVSSTSKYIFISFLLNCQLEVKTGDHEAGRCFSISSQLINLP